MTVWPLCFGRAIYLHTRTALAPSHASPTQEPLFERVSFDVTFSSSADPPALIATLTTDEDVNMNISRDFLESMLSYMDTWRADFYSTSNEDAAVQTFHPYYIRNDTGEPFISYVSEHLCGFLAQCAHYRDVCLGYCLLRGAARG